MIRIKYEYIRGATFPICKTPNVAFHMKLYSRKFSAVEMQFAL